MADKDQRFVPIDLPPKKAKLKRFGPDQFVVPKSEQGKAVSMSDAFKLAYRRFHPMRPDAEGKLERPDVGPYLRPKEKPTWQKLLTPVEKPEREDKGFQPKGLAGGLVEFLAKPLDVVGPAVETMLPGMVMPRGRELGAMIETPSKALEIWSEGPVERTKRKQDEFTEWALTDPLGALVAPMPAVSGITYGLGRAIGAAIGALKPLAPAGRKGLDLVRAARQDVANVMRPVADTAAPYMSNTKKAIETIVRPYGQALKTQWEVQRETLRAERARKVLDLLGKTESTWNHPVHGKVKLIGEVKTRLRKDGSIYVTNQRHLPAQQKIDLAEDITRVKKQIESGVKPDALIEDIAISTRPTRAKNATLQNITKKPDEVQNSVVGDLRNLSEIIPEVNALDHPQMANYLTLGIGKLINPSVFKNTPVERVITAFLRQRMAGEQLAETAVSVALDRHMQRFTANIGHILPINKDTGMWGKTGRLWNDVFSDYQRYYDRGVVTKRQRDYIEDFHLVIEEIESLRIKNGLQPRKKGLEFGEYFYTPRSVEEIQGLRVKHTDFNAQRLIDDATEGFEKGIKYNVDPRETLKFYVNQGYKEITNQQLAAAIQPYAVSVGKLIDPKYNRALTKALRLDGKARRKVNRMMEQEKERLGGKAPSTAFENKAKKLAATEKQQQAINKARRELQKAVKEYRDRDFKYASAKLFGLADDKKISIKTWNPLRKKNNVPAFLPEEDVKALEIAMGLKSVEHNRVLRLFLGGTEKLGNYTRLLAAGLDFGAPFIQGLPVLARNPVVWSKATFRHFHAFLDPSVQARYMEKNIKTLQWMQAHGVPIGDPEMTAALRAGGGVSIDKVLRLLPKNMRQVREGMKQQAGGAETASMTDVFGYVAKQTVGRFAASYNTFLTSARVELINSMRPTWQMRGGTNAELAKFIRNMTGGLDSRALGVGPAQRSIESMWLAFSPRLLRSTVALLGDSVRGAVNSSRRRFDPSVRVSLSQHESMRTVAQYLTGVHSLYLLSGIAMGKSQEELIEGLDPTNGKRYLSHQINGEWYGVGGQIRAMTQATAMLISTGVDEGKELEDLLSTDIWENPLLQFYSGRSAVAPRIYGTIAEGLSMGRWDARPYDTITGPLDIIPHLGKDTLPFTIQGRMEGESNVGSGISWLGLRVSPETPKEVRDATRNEMTKSLYRSGALQSYLSEMTGEQIREIADGSYENLPIDAKDVIKETPLAKAAEEAYLKEKRKEQNDFVAYQDEQKAIKAEFDDEIKELTSELKKGPYPISYETWRKQLSGIKREKAKALDALRDDNAEVLEFLKEDDDEDATPRIIFDAALEDYIEETNDESLEVRGFFQYEEFEKAKNDLRDRHTDEVIDRVESYLRRNETELEKEWRDAKETLEPYWNLPTLLNRAEEKIWDEYLKVWRMNEELAQDMERRDRRITQLRSRQRIERVRMRRTDPDIDVALVKWYGLSPSTPQGAKEARDNLRRIRKYRSA